MVALRSPEQQCKEMKLLYEERPLRENMEAPDARVKKPFWTFPLHFSGCHVKKRGGILLADRTKAPALRPVRPP